MKRALRFLTSSLVLLAAARAQAKDLPSYDASFAGAKGKSDPGTSALSAQAQRTLTKLGTAHISGFDPRTGAPSFVWGGLAPAQLSPSGAPLSVEETARAHLKRLAGLYEAPEAALDSARVEQIHDTGRGGILVVFRQYVAGVPLYQHDIKVLMRRDGSLVAASGGPHPLAMSVEKLAAPFALPARGAVARALSDLYSVTIPASALSPAAAGPKGAWSRFDLKDAPDGGLSSLRFEDPARARKVLFVLPERLVPAYYLEVFSRENGAESDTYGYVVAADDGRILKRTNLTAHAEFKYRVWADGADNRPMDGPIADFTPHPTGIPDGSYPPFVAPSLITIDGFNQFQDPWLAADATVSRGNNADAYTDHDDSNNVNGGDVRATITAPGELDHVYDTALSPVASQTQEMAAVTQLFYTVNWLHDYWYDSGFDEAAGNAQEDNYGRGGQDGDLLRAEAQDAFDDGAVNNANMATPEDGQSPRMQMYVWDGKEDRSITVEGSPDVLKTGSADFCPTSFDLTDTVVLTDDGVSPKANACETIVNNIAGQIALVDRGMCTFHEKAINVEAAGAVGMILINNQAGDPPQMPGGNFPDVSIPVLSVTQDAGNTIKATLLSGPVTVTMHREAGVQVDGTIDNLVVAHEWGHYIHHRLVSCALNQCGAESEGWGDFLALATQVRETDDLDGTFSDSVYATVSFGDAAYFGTRRMPYTADMTKNPLTFKHIVQGQALPMGQPIVEVFPDNAETHNAGEIWCSMMFEGYVSVLKQSKLQDPPYTFDEARRRMTDYVVAGMKLAPVEPTYTEQRDAVLAAAYATDLSDALLIAEGFAKRGAGSCAKSPAKDSLDNAGVVESYVVAAAVDIDDVSVDDSVSSCDNDGVVDANEVGRVAVTLGNHSFVSTSDVSVKVTTTTAGVSFPNGSSQLLPLMEGFAQNTVSFDMTIDPKQKASGFVELTITMDSPDSCEPTVVTKRVPRIHYDNAASASEADDFESDLDVWERDGAFSDEIWRKETDTAGNRLWRGIDYPTLSDTSFVSPPLTVSTSDNLEMTFRHRYRFESSDGEFWDGAVIEISSDGGGTWDDLSQFVDPSYGGVIGNQANNPLSNRMGYVDKNPQWPSFDTLTLDLGTQLGGKTILVRFRIGTDEAVGHEGWEIDDVAFNGIAGKPFPVVITDAQSCSPKQDNAPVADAGPDQTVQSGATVTLDASNSADPDGDELTFSWSQASGPAVTLALAEEKATFTAPSVSKETEMVFTVRVASNNQANDDTVRILVRPAESDLEVAGGGCSCAVPGESQAPRLPGAFYGAALLGLLGLRRRRRG